MMSRESPVARQLSTILGIDVTESNQQHESLGLEDIRIRAGGRHGNDHTDFRSIRIMPTIEELTTDVMPYLPLNTVTTEAEALDRQFRLLREDMVGPARTELKLLQHGEGNLRNLFNQVAIEKVVVPTGKTSATPYVLVSFTLPKEHRTMRMSKVKERIEYWKTCSKGQL